ncbi:hypothetical protein FQN54_008252 [Arachnomyces sp. PD_36]|nr:hypothetical protein FQN54_008252 [Arachnomyces sp. PD_36]
MASSKPQHPSNYPILGAPPTPQSPRALRKFQSHQQLSSNSPSLITQQRQQLQRNAGTIGLRGNSGDAFTNDQPTPTPSGTGTMPSHSRTRSNSDVAISRRSSMPAHRQSGSGRKSRPSLGTGKRSTLDTLLRDGPPNGDVEEGLQELRYLVLSNRVDSDIDGMSPNRIYLWLALLRLEPFPTDDYLALVHRGRSPAYTKIRNDTFRTLATDPLFKRRVTEASLIRLLNAVAWRIHDAKRANTQSRSPSGHMKHRSEGSALANEVDINQDTPSPPAPQSATADSAVYVQGMNVLCAPFLYAARSEVEAFALFHYFVTRECPGYIRGAMDGVHKGLKLVDKCLEVVEPKLANHLFSRGMHAELYAFPSVLTMCACTPPLPEVLHLWDFLFAYGPHLNILCIVAQLIRMRDSILSSSNPNKILRSFPPLDAKEIIALTVLIVRKIPDGLYEELVNHAK